MIRTNQTKAYLFALTTVVFWSTIATAFKLTLEHAGFIQVLFFSSVISTIVLFLLLVFRGKSGLLFQLKPKDYLNGAIRGALNPFLYYLVLLKAYTLLKAQEAGTLNYIWPIMLVLLSIPFLKQKIGYKSILAILVSFFGIIIISTEGRLMSLEFKEPMGVFLALISSVFWALYWILNIKDKSDEILKLFVNFSFGSLFIFITLLLTEGIHLPNLQATFGIVYIGLFEMGITFFLWLNALKYSENTARVSNLIYLSPFLSLLIIRIMLGEKILLATIIGLGFIVAGIFGQHYFGKKKK